MGLDPATTPQDPTAPIDSYIRTFKGIIGHTTSPLFSAGGSMMGAHADAYFSAHGYKSGTVRMIQRAYKEADGMDAFVNRLSGEGVPIAEAQYMYTLILNC
jgi:hypothetical protein